MQATFSTYVVRGLVRMRSRGAGIGHGSGIFWASLTTVVGAPPGRISTINAIATATDPVALIMHKFYFSKCSGLEKKMYMHISLLRQSYNKTSFLTQSKDKIIGQIVSGNWLSSNMFPEGHLPYEIVIDTDRAASIILPAGLPVIQSQGGSHLVDVIVSAQ